MDELKPCPFCGDVKDLQILNMGDLVGFECHYTCEKIKGTVGALNHSWFVSCPTCGATGPEFFVGGNDWENRKTDEQCQQRAIEAWNRRPEPCKNDT